MIPILYKAKETDFTHNGIGSLAEAVSCTVTENRNGSYEMTLEYPLTGRLFGYIQEDCIVKAKPNDTSEPQLFRIYKSSKPMNSRVTFYGEHISYVLSGIPIEAVKFENANAQTALEKVLAAGMFEHSFTAQSDITTVSSTSLSLVSIRAALGGVDGSILDTYHGEYEFDNFVVKLHESRGRDTGIKIAYGKNLTDFKQEKSIAETYTALFPYARYTPQNEDGSEAEEITVTLSEKIISSPYGDNYAHVRVLMKDFSEFFDTGEEITEVKLRTVVQSWVKTSEYDVPSVNITVKFKSLWKTPEYAKYALLERVSLCDTVCIEFEKLGVSATAKVIKTVYDVLREQYNSIELGNVRSDLADTINQNTFAVESVKREVKEQTTAIKEVSQGYKAADAQVAQAFQAADGQVLSAINETLKSYSTTKETESFIQQTANSIMSEVNKKVDDSDFGTKIAQNYTSVSIAWNNISKYIEYANGALNIYESTEQGFDNLLMSLNSTGACYYSGGRTIGEIGTGKWTDDDSFRGLVFDLENGADYMCWSHKENDSDDTYTVKLIYYANEKKASKGLHFCCATYCGGNLYINDYVRTANYSDGSGGLYSETHPVSIYGSGSKFTCGIDFAFESSTNKLVDCYNNIDLHNYSILNQSDARYKENIAPTSINAISALSAIELKAFDWIESGEHSDIGFIAQQLQEVMPELVNENKKTGRLSVKTDKLIPYLVKAVQELSVLVAGGNAYSTGWTDGYTEEEKRQFIIENQPLMLDKEIVENKPILIPISKPKEEVSANE